MNEFHKHLVAKFFPNANYDDLSLGEVEKFVEQIEYICQAQANACKRVYDEEYAESSDYFGDYVLSAEITEKDYE